MSNSKWLNLEPWISNINYNLQFKNFLKKILDLVSTFLKAFFKSNTILGYLFLTWQFLPAEQVHILCPFRAKWAVKIIIR